MTFGNTNRQGGVGVNLSNTGRANQGNGGALPPGIGNGGANPILPPGVGNVPGGRPSGNGIYHGYDAVTPGGRDGGLNAPGRVKVGGLLGGDLVDAAIGAVLGLKEGWVFGATAGGKFGGAGGWIVGAVAQLIGYAAYTIIFATPLMVTAGALFGTQYVKDLSLSYRETMAYTGPGTPQDSGYTQYPDGTIVPGKPRTLSADIEETIVLLAGEKSQGDILDITGGNADTLLLAQDNNEIVLLNSSDQELINLQSAMASFTSGSGDTLDHINTDTGFGSETLLLATNQ